MQKCEYNQGWKNILPKNFKETSFVKMLIKEKVKAQLAMFWKICPTDRDIVSCSAAFFSDSL